jgi:hypothetical protein
MILKLQHSQVLVQQHVLIKVQAVPYFIVPSTTTDQLFLSGVQMVHPFTIVQKYWITLWTAVHGKSVCTAHTRYSFIITTIKVIIII